ncbi:hypothetical protein [Sediminibacillus halophilus]|uniref:Uncharacterized protein n=1 Tax=Sediminibacillus halophilus TaxID=482461 RepID=A0A1G9Y2Z1_9BACI|nr:hypothetical protein [Sediminibacillus halophilus]SDN03390.1 hypothetical protein SAMN05216244_4024 [Sediminibacillus halophilus]
MKLITTTIETIVLAIFSVMFAGYALFIYPFEKLNEKANREVKAKQVKYSPQVNKA